MNRFYQELKQDWLDKPSVCLAFGVTWALDVHYTPAVRRLQVMTNICSLHRVKQLADIDPKVFLKTLSRKRILHSLPDELDRFKDEGLTQQGPYGSHYKSLHPGWFNAPKVSTAFGFQYDANEDPKERERKIKGAIYWDLGVVSLSQVHPKDFCELVIDRGIGFTLPQSLVRAAGGGHA